MAAAAVGVATSPAGGRPGGRRRATALLVLLGLLPALARAADATPPDPPPADPATPRPGEEAPAEAEATPAPAEAPAEAPPARPAEGLPEAPAPAADTWLDTTHEAVSTGLLWTVERFDRFFSDERRVDLPRASSFFRWRSELRLRDDGSAAAGTSLQAEVHLPAFDERLARLRLAIIASTPSAPDPLSPGRTPPDALDRASAGLQLALHDSIRATVDTQAGLLFHLPLGWFVRLRARQAHPLGWEVVARDALAGFWQTNTGFGTRQDASLERPLARVLMARLDGTGTVTERSRGWEWAADASLLLAIGERTAAALSGGALGATQLGAVVERYRVLARVRHDVLRRWILLELQPEVEWLRLPGGHRQRIRAVIVRLELQFDAAALASGADTRPVTW